MTVHGCHSAPKLLRCHCAMTGWSANDGLLYSCRHTFYALHPPPHTTRRFVSSVHPVPRTCLSKAQAAGKSDMCAMIVRRAEFEGDGMYASTHR
jgi:hypothetical protein